VLRAERAVLLAAICPAGSRPHEALHVLGWRLAAGIGAEAIRIGWSARALAPYAISGDLPVPARRSGRWIYGRVGLPKERAVGSDDGGDIDPASA